MHRQERAAEMKRYALALLLVALAACSTTAPAPAVFDFGPPPATAAPATNVQLLEVTAPPWLSGSGLAYRLDYRDPFRREVYRDSRWVAPPPVLLAERLRQRAASAPGAAAPVQLRLELEECSQIFSSPTQSRVLLRVRAWAGPASLPPKVFELSRPAPSADAEGGVIALSQAGDALIDQVLAWAATPSR